MDEAEEQERGTGRNKMLCQALLPKMFCKKKNIIINNNNLLFGWQLGSRWIDSEYLHKQ